MKQGIIDPFDQSSEVETSITKIAVPPTRFFAKYGHELSNSNNLTIYKNAYFTDIKYDTVSGNIQSVAFKSNPETRHTVVAKVYIMCLGGIENARILLELKESNNNAIM